MGTRPSLRLRCITTDRNDVLWISCVYFSRRFGGWIFISYIDEMVFWNLCSFLLLLIDTRIARLRCFFYNMLTGGLDWVLWIQYVVMMLVSPAFKPMSNSYLWGQNLCLQFCDVDMTSVHEFGPVPSKRGIRVPGEWIQPDKRLPRYGLSMIPSWCGTTFSFIYLSTLAIHYSVDYFCIRSKMPKLAGDSLASYITFLPRCCVMRRAVAWLPQHFAFRVAT